MNNSGEMIELNRFVVFKVFFGLVFIGLTGFS